MSMTPEQFDAYVRDGLRTNAALGQGGRNHGELSRA